MSILEENMTANSQKIIFHVKPRDLSTTKASVVRNQGGLPANIYGLKMDSEAVIADLKAFEKLYEAEGDTGLIYLEIEGENKQVPVLIDEVNYHPVTGAIEHAVFRRVNLAEKINAEVPVELVGENEVPNSMVLTVVDALEVSALPTDLPDKFEVDISALKDFGDTITIGDLKYDREKVEIQMTGEVNEESPVVLLQEVKEEVEPEEEASVEDVEVGDGEEAEESTEAPAEE